MRVIYAVPGMGPCGGVRVILEHCTRLQERGHDVTILNPRADDVSIFSWFGDMSVPVVRSLQMQRGRPDIVVATGASTVYWSKQIPARSRFYFVQMMEYKFFKEGRAVHHAHEQSYREARRLGYGVITIADWLQATMWERWEVPSTIIPNGVNTKHFHPIGKKKEYILVEGDNRNQAKDIEGISWHVAAELRRKYGVGIYGYAATQHQYRDMMDRFVFRPDTATMRQLYSGALFLLKASRYEGRACAPVEAMACGTPTVRGLIEGDDDLIHEENCLRGGYDYDEVLALGERMMQNKPLRQKLARGCKKYVKKHLDWDKIIDRLESACGI